MFFYLIFFTIRKFYRIQQSIEKIFLEFSSFSSFVMNSSFSIENLLFHFKAFYASIP